MHTTENPKKVLASAVISELQSSDMYLTLVARLFDLRANLNGVRVTEAFLDEIVENESKYVCHPLYADIRGLLANKTVGHMYNARTGEFHSTQIGAFYRFEKEVDGDNAYLLGYARVPKRNKALCKVLSDLFTDNALKFSFEVNCGSYSEDSDGTMVIDADASNYWEGECVVTFPACETAIAKQIVAECLDKGDENMVDANTVIAESEATEIAEVQTEIAETVEVSETVNAEEAEVQIETAEVTAETIYVHENHFESDSVTVYNPETGEEIEQRTTVETVVHTPVQLAEEEDKNEDEEEERKCNAETEPEETENNEEEEPEKKIAEAVDFAKLVAEVLSSLESLRTEVAELKAAKEIVAETTSEQPAETVIAEQVTGDAETTEIFNPFMASISIPKKYSLLEKEEKSASKYSLLERV